MLDSVSLDHLRMFIAAADEGSFSAGGRRLRRAQSVISQTLANLETQLGVKLFDRSSRSPVLTGQGLALLAEARAVVSRIDAFKARAKGLSGGLEPELSVVVDVMFPLEALTGAVAAFQAEFLATPLTLYVEAPGAALQPVMDGRCAFGVMGLCPPRLHTLHLSACSAWDGPLSRLHRILWRHSRARFQRVCLRNTGNWFSQTVPNCRKERTSAFFRRTPGGSPILARSTPSYPQV
jgi:DNA-binding transcriptional LysR family regulator